MSIRVISLMLDPLAHITFDNHGESIDVLPEHLKYICDRLHKGGEPWARDIASSFRRLICPTCLGQKTLGQSDAEIICPICNGTGWKDGKDPTALLEGNSNKIQISEV